jgi:hypothetical protein
MPFAATTRDRVMGALNLPITMYYVQQVDQSLLHVEAWGGEPAVTRIEGYLTQYEAQATALNTGSASAGLVKADVLEWERGGGKLKGIKAEMGRLRGLIARSLLLDHLTTSNSVRLVR